jgi:hypothetical protein
MIEGVHSLVHNESGEEWVLKNQFLPQGFYDIARLLVESASINWEWGFCQGIASELITVNDIIEPTIGVNGYARRTVALIYPTFSMNLAAGERTTFTSTAFSGFIRTAPGWDKEVDRMFFVNKDSQKIVSMSVPMPAFLTTTGVFSATYTARLL